MSVLKSLSVGLLLEVRRFSERLAELQRNKLPGVGVQWEGGVWAVHAVIMSPQILEDLCEKHVTVHLVRADVCVLLQQPVAVYQLSEGLRSSGGFRFHMSYRVCAAQ